MQNGCSSADGPAKIFVLIVRNHNELATIMRMNKSRRVSLKRCEYNW